MLREGHHVILSVTDFDRELAFFKGFFGVGPRELERDEYAEWDLGGIKFAIHSGFKGPVPSPNNFEFYFNVENIREVVAGLRRRATPITLEPKLMPFGAYLAAFKDPEGNEFWLMERTVRPAAKPRRKPR